MAESKVSVQCKIVDIQKIPNSLAHIISIEFKLGERVWHKGFRVNYDRAVSMEEFMKDLAKKEILPTEPEDFMAYIKEEADVTFTIEIEEPAESVVN